MTAENKNVSNSVTENSEKSVKEKNSRTPETESAPLMIAENTTADMTDTITMEENRASGGSSITGNVSGGGGSAGKGGGGGSSSAASVTTAESATEDMAQTPMLASLEYYVNVYSVDTSLIENSEYAGKITNLNGERTMYLSDAEYTELCEKLGIEPKFKETRIVNDLNGYNVIIVLE